MTLLPHEAARFASVCVRTIANWIDRGLLRGRRLEGSNHRRIESQDLIAFLQQHDNPIPPALLRVDLKGSDQCLIE